MLSGAVDHDGTRAEVLSAADRAAGLLPAGVILCAGGTSVGAFDRIGACIEVAHAAGLPGVPFLLTLIAIITVSSFGVAGVGGGATFAALIVLSALDFPVALAGLLAPTVGSYLRLQPASMSGYWCNWGGDHRGVTVRVS